MPSYSITTNAAELCQQLIADPHADSVQKSLARQLLDFVESFCSDRQRDPFYEECIRHLTLDITGQAL